MSNTNAPENFLELRVLGLQRSGNHAIIEWILEQHRGKKSCFLNNVRHGDHDPYGTAEQTYFSKVGGASNLESVRLMPKHILIYSYEDVPRKMQNDLNFVQSVCDHDFEKKRETYLGASRYSFDIIILRDPFNFFASRLKKLDSLTGTKDLDLIKENWKSLARHALQKSSGGFEDKIVISYNSWFADKRYRQKLSKKLRGSFSDASLCSVPSIGGGSSFDSTSYGRVTLDLVKRKWKKIFDRRFYLNLPYYCRRAFAQGAQNMKVLERWQELRDDSRYQRLFHDAEMLELSEAIFGPIPGTEDFVRKGRETYNKQIGSLADHGDPNQEPSYSR